MELLSLAGRVPNVSRRAAIVAAALLIAGCRAPGPAAPQAAPDADVAIQATTQPADVPRDSNAALIEYLSAQPTLRAEPAYRAAYLLWRGEPFAGEFTELARVLADGKIINRHWSHEPNAPLRRGEVGYVVCRACDVRTGLNWQLTGLGRYAWRELQYREIAGPGSEWQRISGGEFVGILGRADEYLARHGKGTGFVELGAESGSR